MKQVFIALIFGLALAVLTLVANVRIQSDIASSPAVSLGQIGQYEDSQPGVCDRALLYDDHSERGFPLAIIHLNRHDTKSTCSDYFTVSFLPIGFAIDWLIASLLYVGAWRLIKKKRLTKQAPRSK
jgi:hypothetical protein